MSGRDTDFDAIKASDIFEEARDRLEIAKEAESKNREGAKDDLKFREGDQWDHDYTTTASEESPELTINLTDALVRRVVNNMKQQRPRGKAHPMGDDANIQVAELINGIGRHIEVRSEASVAYDTAGECAVAGGWGYCRMVAEYVAPDSFEKDLRILPIRNIFTVYLDPSSVMPSGCDAMWGLISIMMKRTEYKRLHPGKDDTAWSDDGNVKNAEWENREDIRLAEYFRIVEKAEKLYRIQGVSGKTYTRWASELKLSGAILASGDKIIDERESAKREVQWFRLNGTKVIDREILPGTFIPIFRCEGNVADLDGRVIRRGMVRAMKDPQRMVNYGEVAKIKRLGLAPKAPWIGAEGQFDGHPEWDDANLKAYSKLEYKPTTVSTAQGDILLPPPQRQPPAQIEAGFSEFVQGMRTNLLAVAGMPNEPGADLQGQVISGKALQRRQYLSDQSHFQYYDNQTLMIAQVWRVMLEWIPHYYREPGRMQRIIGEDGTPRMVTLQERVPAEEKLRNDITVGRYDVVMDTGPGYETKREEGAENLIELLKVQALAEIIAKTAPDLVFRSIDHPYMQELADRLVAQTPEGLKQVMDGLPERAKAIIQALATQNQNLQQALQAAQMDAKHGITKAHLAAATKAHDTEVNAETKRFDTLVKSHTAIGVAEISAGSKLIDTKVQAEHEKGLAAMTAKAAEKAETEG